MAKRGRKPGVCTRVRNGEIRSFTYTEDCGDESYSFGCILADEVTDKSIHKATCFSYGKKSWVTIDMDLLREEITNGKNIIFDDRWPPRRIRRRHSGCNHCYCIQDMPMELFDKVAKLEYA